MVAQLVQGDDVVQQAPLPFAGTRSTYTGSLQAKQTGTYIVRVLAMDPGHANFGWVRREVAVR